MKTVKIRRAVMKDVPAIHKIIGSYASSNEMLPRSYNEIYENLQTFFIADIAGKAVGCCALQVSWEDLAEVKALAVSNTYKKCGIGTKLVNACIKEAQKLGIKKLFCLTYVPKFFVRFGFKKVSKNSLPHKIWSECIRCPHFPNCNEIPMMRVLG